MIVFPIFEHFFLTQSLYEKMVMPVCQQFGLTYMEFTVLMFLVNNPQYDTAAQIVKVRRLTKSHVSMSLRTLQEKELVEGIFYPGNRKTVHLKVTEKAGDIAGFGKTAQKKFGDSLVKNFTDEEKTQLQYLMNKLNDNLKLEAEQNG